MDDKIRLALEILGTDGVKGLQAALAGLNDESGQVAAALGRGELSAEQYDAEMKRVSASAKNLEAVLRGLNAEMARQAGDVGHHADAAEARELAEAEEMLAAALRHEEEMARSAAEETRKLAEAERDGVAQVAAFEQQQREAADAAKKLEAANRDLNRALRDDATAELRGKLAALEAEAGDVATAFARGDISARVFARDMDLIGDEAAQLKGQLAGLEQATRAETAATDKAATAKGKLETAAKKAGQGMAGFGQSTLQAGRIVQDFTQGGFAGVLNNIEGFVQAIGLGSGAAGALTILGTAAFLAMPKIKEFLASFAGTDEAIGRIEALKARVKELEENPGRVAVDTRELDLAREKLDKLAKAQAEFDAQQSRQNVGEAASGRAVEEAIDESATGAAGVEDKVKTRLIREATATSIPLREAQDRQAKAEERRTIAERQSKEATTPEEQQGAAQAAEAAERTIAAAQEAARKARIEIEKDAAKTYGQMLVDAKKGHGAIQEAARKKLAEQLRAVGEEGVAVGVEAADPVQLQKDAQFIERQKHQAQLDKALQAKLLEKQQQQVDDLSKSEALAPDAQGFAKAANADGAAAEDAFEAARKQVTATILAKLKAKGLGADGVDRVADEAAEKIANAAAESITKKAFESVGQNQTRAEKAAAKGEKQQGARTLQDLQGAEKLVEADVKGDAKKAQDTLGKQLQAQFEVAMARNNAARAQGGGVDPAEMERRLRLEMFAMIKDRAFRDARKRGVKPEDARNLSVEVAQRASRDIAEKGNADLGRRAADASNSNLSIAEQTLRISNGLIAEYQQMSGIQRQLMQEVQRQQRQLRSAVRQQGNR